jgi:hypothetical protein
MRKLALVLAAVAIAASPSAALADHLPESDAESLVILHDYYPGYWWDHTDITVAVQAAPNVDPALLDAARDAIEVWDTALRAEFGGLITLTDVTSELTAKHKADIVIHYVPRAGGTVFGGYAICGDHKCPNILVRSDLPPSYGVDPYSPTYLGYVTLHELGHALGLGHATNLLESTDLMGYGWNRTNGIEPVLSDCDLDAIRYIFQWAFDGVEPYAPPANGPYDCSLD